MAERLTWAEWDINSIADIFNKIALVFQGQFCLWQYGCLLSIQIYTFIIA
jgi:hypothetical protein